MSCSDKHCEPWPTWALYLQWEAVHDDHTWYATQEKLSQGSQEVKAFDDEPFETALYVYDDT